MTACAVKDMKHSLYTYIFYWLPPIALMVIIFFLSSRQSIAVTEDFISDFIIFKSLHIAEYGLLTYLLARAIRKTTDWLMSDVLMIAALTAILYGITDEIHQTFVPTRSGAIRDIFIDSIGVYAAYFLIKTKGFFRLRVDSA